MPRSRKLAPGRKKTPATVSSPLSIDERGERPRDPAKKRRVRQWKGWRKGQQVLAEKAGSRLAAGDRDGAAAAVVEYVTSLVSAWTDRTYPFDEAVPTDPDEDFVELTEFIEGDMDRLRAERYQSQALVEASFNVRQARKAASGQ